MATSSTQRSPVFIAILVIFSLAIILFISVLIKFIQNPSPTPSIPVVTAVFTFTSVPSPTPSSTSTITITPRPTWTLRPSTTVTNTPTPTSTLTPTLIPTITAAKAAQLNTFYELKSWDLSEQERTIELLKADTILQNSFESYEVLAFAEGEAGLRFPDAVNAIEWSWDRAYNLIRIDDPQAMVLYANLIQSGIVSGQVRTSDLPTWFAQYETRLDLQTSPLPPQPGELSRLLLEISGPGSAYFWLVETPNGVNIYPLINDIDFDQPHENSFLYDDLTGDSAPDLVIYRRTSPGNTQQILPHIYNLSIEPPVEIPIQDQIPTDFGLEPRAEVDVLSGTGGINQLQLTNTLLPACPTYVTQQYIWDGAIFTVSPLQYELIPITGQETFCEIVLDAASAGWGPEAAIDITLPLLDVWPPATDIQGKPYPPDAYDELRYRLGILYALAGQSSEAVRYLGEIVNTPVIPDSSWITPAQDFLNIYQFPQDLYLACQQAQFCNLRDAMRTMVSTSGLAETQQVFSYLQNNGITIRSSGLFDFDLDGEDERWVITQPNSQSKLEFWILSKNIDGVQAVFAQVLEGTESLPYYHEPAGSTPVVQFELQKGFVFRRLLQSLEAYIEWVDVEYARPTIILDEFTIALNALMDGADPKLIQNDLLELLNSPRFKGDCIAFNFCDQFHYTLGLVHDLNGEFGNAIDQYLWVWRNYPKSPYTTPARLKLNYFPLPTYTNTPIKSPTPTRTRTPSSATPTSTQTVTPTMTISPTPTITSTVTPTLTSTIVPTDTETNTPTSTP
jgi:hypothetical protein